MEEQLPQQCTLYPSPSGSSHPKALHRCSAVGASGKSCRRQSHLCSAHSLIIIFDSNGFRGITYGHLVAWVAVAFRIGWKIAWWYHFRKDSHIWVSLPEPPPNQSHPLPLETPQNAPCGRPLHGMRNWRQFFPLCAVCWSAASIVWWKWEKPDRIPDTKSDLSEQICTSEEELRVLD